MADHRDTDDLLKSRLNADQIGRERMCLAILGMENQYTRVEPRRPEGGPDGARDIQAVLNGTTVVWGAVGFQNSVTDSAEDKRNTIKKFNDDLISALAANPDLKAFVFFTNVDLTPGEVDSLRDAATKKGIASLDVFWRERLRNSLDSPRGLAFRYQYLKMPLTEAEQASFFSSFGSQLETLITKQGADVQEGVRRLEFLHWMSRPLRSMTFTIHFDNDFGYRDFGPFRAACKLFTVPEIGNAGWWLGGHDHYLKQIQGGKRVCNLGSETVFSNADPVNLIVIKGGVRVYGGVRTELDFSVAFNGPSIVTPETLDGRFVEFFVTDNIAEHVKRFSFHMNGYAFVHYKALPFRKTGINLPWPNLSEPRDWPHWCREDRNSSGARIDLSWTPPRSDEIPRWALS